MSVEGFLDRCDADRIAGWVLFTEDPGRRARLEIHAGDMFLGSCMADVRRQDLVDGGLGDGHCAFMFVPPPDLPEAAVERIVIRIVGTEYVFRSGMRWMLPEPPPADEPADGPKPARRFRGCTLHIGTEKTGTTSLQAFLALNRQAFERAGYFTPLSLAPHSERGVLNHIHLATYAMDDARFNDDMRRSLGVHDADSLQRYREQVRSSLADEVATLDARCDVMILSSEHCHSRVIRPREIRRLKDLLDPYCDRYEIVVYLRPQHELAMSQYGMFVASGICDIDMFPPLPPPPGYGKLKYTNMLYFDYHDLLQRWSAVFGQDAVVPRLYDSQHLREQNIIDDFMHYIPMAGELLIRPEKRNTNISENAQKFLINLFSYIDDGKRAKADTVRKRVRAMLQACCPGHGIVPSRAAVAGFLEQFRHSNEQVRLRWFPEREELFEIDLSKFPETQTPMALSAAELYPIIVELLFADPKLLTSGTG